MLSKYFQIVSICLYTSVATLVPQYAYAESNQLKAMKWVKRTTQSDIDNLIRPTITRAFTRKEKVLAEDIIVDVVLDTNISRVRAFSSNGGRKIEISTGFLSLISHMIDANIVSNQFNKQSKLAAYNQTISSFVTSYQDRVRREENSTWPVPFHTFVGIGDDIYNELYRSKQYDQVFSMSLRIVLSYILAHEFAHHVLGHLTVKKPSNLEESRRNEDEADDFSIRINWILGNNPLAVANYFMLFTMVEGGLHEGSHSPSACRLEKFLHAGISFTESEMNNQKNGSSGQMANALLELKRGREMLKTECKKGDAMTNTTVPGLW